MRNQAGRLAFLGSDPAKADPVLNRIPLVSVDRQVFLGGEGDG